VPGFPSLEVKHFPYPTHLKVYASVWVHRTLVPT
jgi:hypothetical protein